MSNPPSTGDLVSARAAPEPVVVAGADERVSHRPPDRAFDRVERVAFPDRALGPWVGQVHLDDRRVIGVVGDVVAAPAGVESAPGLRGEVRGPVADELVVTGSAKHLLDLA